MNKRNMLFLCAWILFAFGGSPSVFAVPRLDGGFGLNGRVAVELGANNSGHAVLVQPDGKIVVAGSSSKGNALNFSLLRFNANGSLDTTFNGDGSVLTSLSAGNDEALALGLLSNGRIIAAGYMHNGKDRDLAMICYRRDGTLDPTFGDAGVVLTAIGNGNEEIAALTINASDMITVVGSTEGTVGRILVAARYYGNGEPDATFGEQGVSLVGIGEDASAEGVFEREDGTLVISGSYEEKKKSSAMLVGLNGDGTVAADFGEKGVAVPAGDFVASEGYGLAVDSDGMIYVAGSVGLPGARETALFRFTPQGKADPGFGKQGVVVTRISKEDDVLYDVDVGKGGVAASGFTTDAGTRQFLLIEYSPNVYTAEATASGRKTVAGTAEGTTEDVSIQEVRVNGNTRIQIRRLQLWENDVQIRELQISDSLSGSSASLRPLLEPFSPSGTARPTGDTLFDRSLVGAGGRIGAFFLPEAHATESSLAESAGSGSALSSRVITTTFSEGEAVSYALTSDGEGNLIVVGTADGNDTSSIVAARYKVEDLVDRTTDQPGQRSRHIATTEPGEITRTTITIGGEIASALGKEVVRRGVVFSVNPGPLYKGQNPFGVPFISGIPRRGMDTLASFFLSEAMAADSPVSRSADVMAGQTGSFAHQTMDSGEAVSGAGNGGFVAVLDHLLPGTVYYIRAYALTTKGEVYYGNQVSVRTADACFIATASFGTFLHPSVNVLRDFRDAFLVNHGLGKRLVDLYYTLSPPLADVIAANPVLRGTVRMLLLPCVGFSWLALQTGLGAAWCWVAVAMAFLGWLVAHWRPRLHE